MSTLPQDDPQTPCPPSPGQPTDSLSILAQAPSQLAGEGHCENPFCSFLLLRPSTPGRNPHRPVPSKPWAPIFRPETQTVLQRQPSHRRSGALEPALSTAQALSRCPPQTRGSSGPSRGILGRLGSVSPQHRHQQGLQEGQCLKPGVAHLHHRRSGWDRPSREPEPPLPSPHHVSA